MRASSPLGRILLAVAALAPAACVGDAAQVASEWPPPDFCVQLEELREADGASVAIRRFVVTADGICCYGRSTSPLVDPATQTKIPVFGTVCAYRLKGECTRSLARRLDRSGVLKLDTDQGDRVATQGRSLRLSYRAFAAERVIQARGQIHGALVQVLGALNAYVPPGEAFDLPGMGDDAEPANLIGVPAPVDSVPGALQFFEQQLHRRPRDTDLILDTFALACAAGERAKAEVLLARWVASSSIAATAAAPFLDPPRLLPEMLQRMLPP